MGVEMKRVLIVLVFSLFFIGCVSATSYYAATDGSGTLCSETSPCSLTSAVETKASSGDMVYLKDGTYALTSQLDVPPGVNIFSQSMDASKVTIVPGANIFYTSSLLSLSTEAPGSGGNQTIGYIGFNATDGSHFAYRCINVKNRDDVTITHNTFTGFGSHDNARAIGIWSTQVWGIPAYYKSPYYFPFPGSSGSCGNDSSVSALWMTNPVDNFTCTYNTFTNCGWKEDDTNHHDGIIELYNLDNSEFAYNTIFNDDDHPNTGEAFVGMGHCSGYIRRTTFHDNNVRVGYWYGRGYDRTKWMLEIWQLWDCSVYNNRADGACSITYTKGTSIYNNDFDESDAPIHTTHVSGSLETTGGSCLKIYHNRFNNYWLGPYGGCLATSGSQSEDIYVWGNYIKGTYSKGTLWRSGDYAGSVLKNVYIYGNTIDCTNGPCIWGAVRLDAHGGTFDNINVKNNILINSSNYGVSWTGSSSGITIDNNLYYSDSRGDVKSPLMDINAVIGDPLLNSNGALQSGSEAIDIGLNLGSDYDSALDPALTDFTTIPPTVSTIDQDSVGPGWDIGAYVYTGEHTPPLYLCGDLQCIGNENCSTCPEDCGNCTIECVSEAEQSPCDGCISNDELLDYIDRWKSDSDVAIGRLMQAIILWKGSC